MKSQFRPALVLFGLLTILTGVIYPLAITAVAQTVFRWQANGSLIEHDGKAVGSSLIGQPFDSPRYFWARPLATGPGPYNAAASTGSNLGPTNPALLDAVKGRVEAIRQAHPDQTGPVPADLVTASASGLDPRARIEIRELLRELKRMGKTIMISSHILSELEEICDRIGIIERGQFVFSGGMEEIRPRLGIQSKVRVKVLGDPTRAVEMLSTLPQIQKIETVGDYLSVTFREGQDTDGIIARTLVHGGVDLVYLQPEQLRLDDAFLQLTKGIVH